MTLIFSTFVNMTMQVTVKYTKKFETINISYTIYNNF